MTASAGLLSSTIPTDTRCSWCNWLRNRRMRNTHNMIKTLEWTDAGVRFIDQTKLPTEETYVTCKTYQEVADAIRNMIVRGAPAIGVAAAMGIALGVRDSKAKNLEDLQCEF